MTVAKRKKAPELTFQQHIADYLVREHKFGVLEQTDITDTEHCLAEDHLWAFLKATQADTLQKLTDDYGTDARDEIFKALRKELEHTPLWMLLRHGLKVRPLVVVASPESDCFTAVTTSVESFDDQYLPRRTRRAAAHEERSLSLPSNGPSHEPSPPFVRVALVMIFKSIR